MKTVLSLLSLLVASLAMSPHVHAIVAAGSATCRVEGVVSGVKLGFIYGGQVISGEGTLRCVTEGGAGYERPVHLGILATGLGYDFSGLRQVRVASIAVGVARADDFLGNFAMAVSAGSQLQQQSIPFESSASLRHKARGINLELGFLGADAAGLGARLHGLVFVVEPRR